MNGIDFLETISKNTLVKLSLLILKFGPINISFQEFGSTKLFILDLQEIDKSFTCSNLSDLIDSAHNFVTFK